MASVILALLLLCKICEWLSVTEVRRLSVMNAQDVLCAGAAASCPHRLPDPPRCVATAATTPRLPHRGFGIVLVSVLLQRSR